MRSGMLLVGLLIAAGCASAPIRQYDLKDQPMTCDEANRACYDTLTGMGFTVTTFTPATPGRSGTVKAARDESGRGAGKQSVTVRIECTAAGATIDAREDGKLLGQIDFKRAFFISFGSTRNMQQSHAAMAARQAAGTAPASLQRGDLQVLVEPVRGHAAKLEFDLDLARAEILPVRVRISNYTPRHYTLDPGEIRLMRADRQRVEALAPEAVAERVTQARTEDGQPLTALGGTDVAARLRAQLFTATQVGPHAEAKGFLFFPLAEYQRARVLLSESESGEAEGFAVEF